MRLFICCRTAMLNPEPKRLTGVAAVLLGASSEPLSGFTVIAEAEADSMSQDFTESVSLRLLAALAVKAKTIIGSNEDFEAVEATTMRLGLADPLKGKKLVLVNAASA